jgi:hypothetical protein
MADAIDVTLHGIPELFRGSRDLFDKIEAAAPKSFGDVAERRARLARAAVPRASGALAGSVGTEGPEVLYGDGLPYAGWVEFGGTRGRPYMPEGRYFYPVTAIGIDAELESEATKTTVREVSKFAWPLVRA